VGDANVYFNSVQIYRVILIIQHDFHRGGCVHKYRNQRGAFFLIGTSKNTGDAKSSLYVDYNLTTGAYITDYTTEDTNQGYKPCIK